jgi:arabinan endo-1,5-alpha-L-arabinosidase
MSPRALTRSLAPLLAAALAGVSPSPARLSAQTPRAAPTGPTYEIGVHDPSIIREGGSYYIFATGRGVSILRSRDLIYWERAGSVFDSLPAWTKAAVPAARGTSLWAPDISFFNGLYHLYYAISSFGSQRSAIGLATNRTLDPASPEYRWVDRGEVIASVPGVSTFNAIDPNVVLDDRSQPWLDWGSFWGGIKMRRLDAATGMLSAEDTTLYSLAARQGTGVTKGPNDAQSVEGPYIIRRGPYYYLFASYDMCCRGVRSTYNVRVGRSAKVTGPYRDRSGKPMTEDGGTLILEGAGRVRGPGHNSVLTEGDRQYIVHHFYDADDNGRAKLQIRPLTWSADGWPAVGEPLAPER